ncbi:ECF transporter S component [Loigolactobacillus zhaoyuanensis]|uniref:Riboflavin transporter n=1 Tax=Loigolactobacillus zhaoyuanensis TaxID=2486017 RepID=A0ABW8U9H2_9LACO|nr:ECF transporter S component [Loigolactobacillus zhaoyuanensis]
MEKMGVRKLVMIAMLAAISYLLMLFSFPVLPAAPFLKLDFSNLPIFLSMFLYGPAAGAFTTLITSLLDFITRGSGVPGLIGEVAYFLATMCFTLPVYYFFKRDHSAKVQRKNMFAGFITGTLSLTVFMSLANIFVLLPIYMKFSGIQINATTLNLVATTVVPFNLIKGVLVSAVFLIAYERLLPWLSRKVLPQQVKKV